ncbi:MAG: hypothetical protein Sylvanvirus4_3 [Sylvanvirus sp.]|uniref:Alpha-ketoglutarate-dependent dioxygenase AlkB-like domain-containing protein n=1 Tax=Sylvanvirus sp. TaxID=2487774 RepID=A0A3G5AKW3_9VIRU|nr:MAG: hypothetical protein Sylvanvirus4_3 [Sylvanvirus sp.]
MFQQFPLDVDMILSGNNESKTNLFEQLTASLQFEDIAPGRKGANLVAVTKEMNPSNVIIPLVRTTSIYTHSSQQMMPIHHKLMKYIQNVSIGESYSNDLKGLEFNHALIEIYQPTYRRMRFHSDQALDLADNSCIGIYSCYEEVGSVQHDARSFNKRKLKIKDKDSKESFEISLDHHSVVLFSTSTNKKYLHKIVLDNISSPLSNPSWLGITFRVSKTFVQFVDEIPYFYFTHIQNTQQIKGDLMRLRLVNEIEKKQFLKYKAIENGPTKNEEYNMEYQKIDYTLSPGDLKPLTDPKLE